ncbi:hypothetical protein SAMN05216337_1017143 [Bradyrhizobium brasilense]|uniref:Uncharacterized protein n=1 Tax=Bradyrhizobium brasilense TaxID=1419277 RepID=A0A1G6YYA0_9BRAD|nr:hypothetical protein [Bradyrhizobium brasilense]SDD95369.1 hypothetical protein SAMN05216337_1017143 [Bradyrhizobium brasilense]
MPVSVSTPADLVNVALQRIGYKGRVGNLFEGSAAAKDALDIYAQTRDEILRKGDWGFAERNLAMELLKSAPAGGYTPPNVWTPASPPLPWRFEYAYPSDCLDVRAIKGQSVFVMDFDPQPITFTVANDSALVPPRKVILCNVPDALLTYTGQVTDPTSWEPDFVEAFAAALGRRLAPALVGMEAAKLLIADEQMSTAQALAVQG